MSIEDIKAAKKVIGAKQTVKAVENGLAQRVFLAEDADLRFTKPIIAVCQSHSVNVEIVPTMTELGKVCGIEVGAAAVAIVKK